jgi:hypothetical protein
MRAHGPAFTGDVITRLQAIASGRKAHANEDSVKTAALGEQLAAIAYENVISVVDVRCCCKPYGVH